MPYMKNFGLYGALLLLSQGLAACDGNPPSDPALKTEVRTQASADTPVPYDRLVVAFGDSLYAGYQLAPGEGFAPALQNALVADGIKARVHNAGVSGDTTAAGMARLKFVLDNLEHKPDLVVLGLGGNDMLRGIKPAETRANLEAMLGELSERHIPVVLTGMLAAPNLGPDYAKSFNAVFPDLAKRYSVPLYPFFLNNVVSEKTLMLPDHIHPNAKGVGVIVKGVAPLVEAALKG
jgi:acyl-CoA thioesterase I